MTFKETKEKLMKQKCRLYYKNFGQVKLQQLQILLNRFFKYIAL